MSSRFMQLLALTGTALFLLLVATYAWHGFRSLPAEGDSLVIHIPIAKAILRGTVVNPAKAGLIVDYPGASELILAAFLALHLPLNVYNVLALVCLFIAVYRLGKTYAFSSAYSIVFAMAICTLYGVLRYVNTQKIDVWMLVFYALSLALLRRPGRSIRYFLVLGVAVGMVIGSKYSGPFFVLVLLLTHIRTVVRLLTALTITRILALAAPLLTLGLSWYIRNTLNTGDPFYPQSFLFIRGNPKDMWATWEYWQVALRYPQFMIDALVSEFMVWSLSLIVTPVAAIWEAGKRVLTAEEMQLMVTVGLNGLVFLLLPPPPLHTYQAVIFGMRYGFPVILVAILATFVLARRCNQAEAVATIALANTSFLLLPTAYHPKLILAYVPGVVLAAFLIRTIAAYMFQYPLTRPSEPVSHGRRGK